MHSGCCGNHAASRTLVGKVFCTGFYWPTALKDAEELIRKCKGCQMFARQAHVPAHNLICIPPAWPFSYWGLDQVGPLKKAKGGFEYIFVAIDKFTKWIEYKPLAKNIAQPKQSSSSKTSCTASACLIESSQIWVLPSQL